MLSIVFGRKSNMINLLWLKIQGEVNKPVSEFFLRLCPLLLLWEKA
jgi:hypothetical protein